MIKGKYGLRIGLYQAGSIYEVERGVREIYDRRDAMLANSLFLDFLKENGLNIHNDCETRDVICIDFSYGSASYEENVKRISKKRKAADLEGNKELVERYDQMLERIEQVKDKFDKQSRERLREIFYQDGARIRYPIFKNKEVSGYEWITYRMAYRTPGKAKRGLCMFIREELHEKAMNFLRMGIKMEHHNAPIVEMGAYSSLITSTIEGRIKIDPDEILIMKDVKVPFVTNVISVEINENHECLAVPRDNYEVTNELFDGQALIDESIFPEWGDGYILLRNHFTKCAAFCTKIQKFFREYCANCGEIYENFQVLDMFGKPHFVKDIKLITTNNAVKWLKLGVQYDDWAEWVRKNGALWGIVKTAHPSKLGDVQRMSYQMVNALNIDDVDSYMEQSKAYVSSLKKDNEEFLKYLERTQNFSNDHEVLVALSRYNPEFMRTDYFRRRKEGIIRGYTKKLNAGRIIQDADNLVIVGSPYAMLLHSVGEDPTSDPTFEQEDGAIQCWTGRFKDGEYLAGFRSPLNSQANIDYLHNHYHEYFDRYFKLGRLIIAVNLNGTDLQDRSNGSDQDSDSLYVTNQPNIVDHVHWCYEAYPTTVNNIPKESKHYDNELKNYAAIDNGLAHSQRNIGESSNLAQICLSYGHTFDDRKYVDYTYILAVLAQLAIDSTKRRFDVDITEEIKRIKEDMDVKNVGYPEFWKFIRKDFSPSRINPDIRCPMNSICKTKYPEFRQSTSTIPIESLLCRDIKYTVTKEAKKVRELINKYALDLNSERVEDSPYSETEHVDYLMSLERYEEFVEDLRQITLGKKYRSIILHLIRQAFSLKNVDENYRGVVEKTRPLLMKILYDLNKQEFLECFKKP